jgi:hypothetical protein
VTSYTGVKAAKARERCCFGSNLDRVQKASFGTDSLCRISFDAGMSSIDKIERAHVIGTGAAPGQYLGYGLQDVRLCMRLLTADDNDVVSTEYLDDVAVRKANGCYLLEQCKSALSQNPVADWSPSLWKTFANWLETTKQLGLNPAETDYILYVNPAKSGRLVAAFHEARSPAHVAELLAELRKAIASRKVAPACEKYLRIFVEADPALCAAMIRNFTLVGISGDPVDEMRKHLAPSVSPTIMDVVCAAAIGWVKNRAAERIRGGEVAEITAAAFHTQLRAIIRRHDRDDVLQSFAPRPDVEAIESEVHSQLYIRQLDAIEIESDDKLRAATDYLRASADRTIWSERGLVHEVSLDEYDDALTAKWSHRRRAVEILAKERGEIERGQLLYAESMQHAERLEGKDVPPHFTPGSYHALADCQEVGWHPRYKEVIPLPKGAGHG